MFNYDVHKPSSGVLDVGPSEHERAAAYKRRWRAANPDKVKEQQRRWRERTTGRKYAEAYTGEIDNGLNVDLSTPTLKFYYDRERVRECLEKRVSMYNPTSYRQIAYWLNMEWRAVKRHIDAIRKEHGL